MKKSKIGYYIIGSAIIWAAVIIGCSLALKGTDCYDSIQNILVAGVLGHILFIWGPLASMLKKSNGNSNQDIK